MIKTFQQIYTEVLTWMGHTEDPDEGIDSTILDSIKLRINQIQSFLFYRKAYEWRKQRFYYSTREPITTGTVSVTKGSRDVTGSGTSWTDIVKYAYIIINDKAFKIDPHATISSTSLKLAAGFSGETVSGVEYKIVFPTVLADPNIASIVSYKIDESEKHVVGTKRTVFIKTDIGEPLELAIGGLTNFTYYQEGTVTVTQDSTAVVGLGTTFTSDMEGMPFRVNDFSVVYTVAEVTSDTTLTLKESYQGPSSSGKGYKIAPEGSLLIQATPVPDDVYFSEIEALIKPKELVRPNDISYLPEHSPLLWGTIWYALMERKTEKNPVRINQAKANFKDSLKMFDDLYKIVTNIKWQSPEEIKARRAGSSRFNPLERD